MPGEGAGVGVVSWRVWKALESVGWSAGNGLGGVCLEGLDVRACMLGVRECIGWLFRRIELLLRDNCLVLCIGLCKEVSATVLILSPPDGKWLGVRSWQAPTCQRRSPGLLFGFRPTAYGL